MTQDIKPRIWWEGPSLWVLVFKDARDKPSKRRLSMRWFESWADAVTHLRMLYQEELIKRQ